MILLWLGSLQESCQYDTDFGILDEGGDLQIQTKAGEAASSLLNVTGLMWFFMHCFGGIIRSLVYIEPLWLDPDDPQENIIWVLFFRKCGP